MKKILSCALTLVLILLTVCALPGAAVATEEEENPQAVLYVWDEVAEKETAEGVLYLAAGDELLVRAEADGEPVELPGKLGAQGVTLDPAPVSRGGKTFYRMRVNDGVWENSACTVGLDLSYAETLPDGSKQFIWRNPMIAFFVFVPKKTPFAKVLGSEEVYESGETLRIPTGGEVKICFDLTDGNVISSGAWSMEPTQILIPGWETDTLTKAGFTVSAEPEMIGDYAYLTVSAAGVAPGVTATLPYKFVMMSSVMGENAVGWEKAGAVYKGTLKIRVTKENGEDVPEVLLGDVDGNGKVEAADARYALRAAVGLDDTAEGLDFSNKTNRCFIAADVKKDGNIMAEDARLILRAAVGLEALS